MKTIDYLRYIVEEIHTVIVATVDGEGLPVTAAASSALDKEVLIRLMISASSISLWLLLLM